ncbi:MAG TPA: sigma-54 dependent transcriptional regulator [Thermoleophilia bacterium]|nr:sigma-54 dependent transcriptional regulator [Thermoleophilia bacterium]
MAIRILAVDDEPDLRKLVRHALTQRGHDVRTAANGKEAMTLLGQEEFDVVLLDLRMPEIGGIQLLRWAREMGIESEIIILTGHADVDTAIEAMRLGAYDYLSKPFRLQEVEQVVVKAAEKRELRKENVVLRNVLARRETLPLLIGQSPAMKNVLQTVEKVAPTDSPVLIQGESGTGKELIARTIHLKSHRAQKPFVAINCGAFQDQLLESELFGHERGAFTGAVATKHGLFEVADGGTLFLDEIGEMSHAMQVRLLRTLDSGEIRRVGSHRNSKVSVRIVAATTKDLVHEVGEHRFREDLFFRISTILLKLPPLRERDGDIPAVVEHFLEHVPPGWRRLGISPDAVAMLEQYSWPGNIRELRNTVERLLILVDGPVITPADLPENVLQIPRSFSEDELAKFSLSEIERLHILRVLARTNHNKTQAARILQIDVKTLANKMKAYKMP